MPLVWILLCSCLVIFNSLALAQPLFCAATQISNQCDTQDIDHTGSNNNLLPNTALNPIDLFSGNKYLREIDLHAHPTTPDLEIVRHYNSMSTQYGVLGGAWTLSYDTRLEQTAKGIFLHQANGTTQSLKTDQGYLEQQTQQAIWRATNGSSWHFNHAGWLIQIQRPNQAPLMITRHKKGYLQHKIDSISQNQRQLQFHYAFDLPLLQRISSPIGNIDYKYQIQPSSELYQLQQVLYPDQRRVLYHYEPQYQQHNPWAITGKSLQLKPHEPLYRMRSWVYDLSGKAIFAMAEQPLKWVRLYYPNPKHPLQTQLHSANGVSYINFNSAQSPTINSVSGASCWACPPNLQRGQNQIQFPSFTVQHDANQTIQNISGEFPGWPELTLHYNLQGQLSQWRNALQQTTQLFYDQGRALRQRFANDDQQQLNYNSQQQITTIDYQSTHDQRQTQIKRPSPQHLHITHPTEDELLAFNDHHQVLRRSVNRRVETPSGTIQWHYDEEFIYDEQQRLIRHQLPEGGALHYYWQNQHLQRLEWENAQGQRQTLAQRIAGGYTYFNGLTQQHSQTTQQHHILVRHQQQLWWHQQLDKKHGLIHAKKQIFPALSPVFKQQSHYGYNAQKQLIIEKNSNQETQFYAWDSMGALAAHNQKSSPKTQRDTSGLAQSWKNSHHNYILRYNALRRLDVVYNLNETVQKNSHNSYGYRVYAQHYPQATQQFFLYHNKKIIAEYSTDLNAKLPIYAAHPISRRYIYLQNQPIALIDYQLNPQGEPIVMHSDHLGAVHLLSDRSQQVRWAASYDAFGLATKLTGDLDLHLRREGQYYDMATGWHDNLLRTYIPQYGHYLEPDPLGPNPNSQLLGYAQQQPLNHTDPWGLVLFAFDGTRYDESSGGTIHQLHQAAQDPSFYAAGPGNPDSVDWDAMVAYSTQQIVFQQWNNLVRYLQSASNNRPTSPIPIDIIGFSRGSAIALHFANQIMSNTQNGWLSYTDSYGQQVRACIQPRFIGLLDGVAQMGLLGSKNYLYNFSVSPAWQWVVHGVAMHEHRYLFPLYSLDQGDNSQEIGLVGAHGDLGGGYPADNGFAALSHVALQWILWHAQAQGMVFNDITVPTEPYAYLHDESSSLENDRNIENSALATNQNQHPDYGEQARQQVRDFLDVNLNETEQIHNHIAKVDLAAYYRWLDQTINWSPN